MSDYSSNASDQELYEHQDGSRKRRRLSPNVDDSDDDSAPSRIPVATISRIKAKKESQPPVKRTQDAATTSGVKEKAMSFASINVAPWLVASLASMEIKKPTGIQQACIPEILKGRDCIGGSRTGTGKTVAFSVPILQKWAEDPSGIFALIVT